MTEQESEQVKNGEEPAGDSGNERLEAMEKTLTEQRTRAENNFAGWQRAQADFINYRRRTEQEKNETIQYANTKLILSILPVLDDFERAIDAIPPESAGSQWLDGVKLIDHKLRSILESQGVKPIEALGQEFDPNLHEAVMVGKGKRDTVIQEVEKGYKLHDKVIRPTKVVVGSVEEANKEE